METKLHSYPDTTKHATEPTMPHLLTEMAQSAHPAPVLSDEELLKRLWADMVSRLDKQQKAGLLVNLCSSLNQTA